MKSGRNQAGATGSAPKLWLIPAPAGMTFASSSPQVAIVPTAATKGPAPGHATRLGAAARYNERR
jgi:hypothetical protein